MLFLCLPQRGQQFLLQPAPPLEQQGDVDEEGDLGGDEDDANQQVFGFGMEDLVQEERRVESGVDPGIERPGKRRQQQSNDYQPPGSILRYFALHAHDISPLPYIWVISILHLSCH